VIGEVAVVRLEGLAPSEKRRFARALLAETPNVTGVFEQVGGIEGVERLRKLRHLAGKRDTLTLHRENGCAFRVDVAKCYFSPRLSTERLRVARTVAKRERVLNMFAGVGPFSIEVARVSGARVESWELNPYACEMHRQNNTLNKVDQLVSVENGDAAQLVTSCRQKFDRILMPHPSQADRFLAGALKLLKRRGVVNYYRHVLGKDEREAASALAREVERVAPGWGFSVRKVREVGPRWLEMEADVRRA
jgi:tRNA (guanine37-N1)-methyltransferase